MSRLKFTKEYAYDKEDDVTVAILGGRDVIITIEPLPPSYDFDFMVCVAPRDATAMTYGFHFSHEGLGDLIAELQRAQSGKLLGRYEGPRGWSGHRPTDATTIVQNAFYGALSPTVTEARVDPELERLLAEEAAIQRAHEWSEGVEAAKTAAKREGEAAEALRQEDEMQAECAERGEIAEPLVGSGRALRAQDVASLLLRLQPDDRIVLEEIDGELYLAALP